MYSNSKQILAILTASILIAGIVGIAGLNSNIAIADSKKKELNININVQGVAGKDGNDGKDGRDGQDSTVPGPPGQAGSPGADGAPGKDGKDGKNGTELPQETIDAINEIVAERDTLKQIVEAYQNGSLKGADGKQGEPGANGTATFNFAINNATSNCVYDAGTNTVQCNQVVPPVIEPPVNNGTGGNTTTPVECPDGTLQGNECIPNQPPVDNGTTTEPNPPVDNQTGGNTTVPVEPNPPVDNGTIPVDNQTGGNVTVPVEGNVSVPVEGGGNTTVPIDNGTITTPSEPGVPSTGEENNGGVSQFLQGILNYFPH